MFTIIFLLDLLIPFLVLCFRDFNDFSSFTLLRFVKGLAWTEISFRDNQLSIDLIGKKPSGLLILLEEQVKV
jgi:hypothetical protein